MKKSLIIANLLGVALALLDISALTHFANGISTLFLNLLKFISLPIVFFSITSTLTSSDHISEVSSLGLRVLKYTLITTIIAASIALAFFVFVDPTNTFSSKTISPTGNFIEGYKEALSKLIPPNFVGAFVENNVVGVAFIGILLSCAILMLPEKDKKFLHQFFFSMFQALLSLTTMILKVLPIGIFSFVYLLVTDMSKDFSKIHDLTLYLVCIGGANLVQGLIILPLFLKLKGLSAKTLFNRIYSALVLAFFSKSSSVALPLNMKLMTENLNVSKKVSSFSLPLCSVVNMNACAGFILITTLFVCSSEGVTFSLFELLIWVFIATIAAIGNAGVPMGCYFLTGALLVGMNVPLKTLGLILPFYTFLDMLETAINVWSDSCITLVIDKELKEKAVKEEVLA